MTQILTRASRRYVMQVSDRLVTRDGSPFDPLANKSLVLATINGVVVLSYTGRAFLDGVPTDQWIAEVLRGERFERSRKPPACTFGSSLAQPDLGRSLARIKQAVTDVRLTDAVPLQHIGKWYGELFEISYAGWQWNRKCRSRPIMGTITKPRGTLNASLEYEPRSELASGKLAFSVVPSGHATREEFAALDKTLFGLLPEATESALVLKIRQIAKVTTTVGSDCLSILIPRPIVGPIYVNYLPLCTSHAVVVGKTTEARIQVAYSPWMLCAGVCYAPSVINGDNHYVPRRLRRVHARALFPYLGFCVPATAWRTDCLRRQSPVSLDPLWGPGRSVIE